MAAKKDIKLKKRNVWSSEEVFMLIELIKEKHILGLMDGKRLRVADIFKTLVAPMNEAGFHRDVSQLTIKWKNLKAEYYKCKRHNGVSGNDPAEYEFFDALDEIVGQRPSAQSQGFDTSQALEITIEELQAIESDDPRITLELYEDAPDADGAIPGGSAVPGIQMLTASSEIRGSSPSVSSKISGQSSSSSKKSLKPAEAFLKMQEDIRSTLEGARQEETEADKVFLDTFLKKQEEMMVKCTKLIMTGLKEIFGNKEQRSDDEDSS